MMDLLWDQGRPLADGEALAALFKVSLRTVRRHCTPVQRKPVKGQPRGEGGKVFYDAITASDILADISPRQGRTARQRRRDQ